MPTLQPSGSPRLPTDAPSGNARTRYGFRWDRTRALQVIARESFDLRHNPAGLARLTLETNGALGLQPDALPALVDAICQASIELGDVVAETAEFHRRESLATKKRLFKEMLELHGAVKIALQTLSASIAATEPE